MRIMPPYTQRRVALTLRSLRRPAVAVSDVVRRMVTYVATRPAREVLFTVVSRDEKYQAKVSPCQQNAAPSTRNPPPL